VRALRLFADAGGSPTAVDVRVRRLEVRAEEIAGGVPQLEGASSVVWWPWVVCAAVGGLALWLWRTRRREKS
jgi:hypothetical protein